MHPLHPYKFGFCLSDFTYHLNPWRLNAKASGMPGFERR